VGNRAIDSNHQKMGDIICNIQKLILANNSAALADEFRLLEDFAQACFKAEGEIARAVGFDFTEHDAAHRELLEKFRSLGAELVARNGSWQRMEAESYNTLLRNWLIEHLDRESRPLMCVLDTQYYDFKPQN